MPLALTLKKPWFLFFLGITFSYCCSAIVTGAVPAFVAMGVLATSWIPIFSTIRTAVSAFAVVISRLLEDRSPFAIVLGCSLYDVILSLLALVMAETQLFPLTTALCLYIAMMSLTPIVASIAQQIYAGELSLMSEREASLFNTLSFSLLPFLSMAITQALGSLLAGWSLTGLIVINLLLSAVSLCANLRAYRTYRQRQPAQAVASHDSAPTTGHDKGTCLDIRTLMQVLRLSLASPLIVALLYFSVDIFLFYLPVWVAGQTAHKSQTIALFTFLAGSGSALGPLLFHCLRKRTGLRRHAFCAMLAIVLSEAALLLLVGTSGVQPGLSVLLTIGLVGIIYCGTSYFSLVAISARQQAHAEGRYPIVVGIAYSSLSIMMLAGTWVGYFLDVAAHPAQGLLLALLSSLVVAGFAVRGRPGYQANSHN